MNSDCSTLKQKSQEKVCSAEFLGISSVYQQYFGSTFLVKRKVPMGEAEN